jgi:hypothetical protein
MDNGEAIGRQTQPTTQRQKEPGNSRRFLMLPEHADIHHFLGGSSLQENGVENRRISNFSKFQSLTQEEAAEIRNRP